MERGARLAPMTKEEAYQYNMLCRHQMILKLLLDIRADIEICKLEGWPADEYIELIRKSLPKGIER